MMNFRLELEKSLDLRRFKVKFKLVDLKRNGYPDIDIRIKMEGITGEMEGE